MVSDCLQIWAGEPDRVDTNQIVAGEEEKEV